jgi:DedD protein
MDQLLKQRLIGTTIIVSLIVIFVPMLFEERSSSSSGTGSIPELPKTIEERSIDLPKNAADLAPPGEDQSPETGYRIIPLDDPPAKLTEKGRTQTGGAVGKTAEAILEESDFAESADVEPVHKRSEFMGMEEDPETMVKDQTRSKTAHLKSSAPAANSNEPAAKKLEPKKTGETAATVKNPPKPQPTKTTPVLAKASPEGVAKLTPAESNKTARASEAKPGGASSLSSWVVQTGSFTGEGNARLLADRLRKANFPAFVEMVPSESGGSVYKVHVGPELSRSRAEQIRAQIENSVGIKGFLLPR